MEESRFIQGEDDGSLAFLNIAPDPDNKFFNCDVIKQQQLANRTFWVTGYIPNVQTKFSKENGQTVVHIMFDPNNRETERKFFTGSKEILYILKKIDEMGKFPRRVTMRCNNNRFYFE